VNAAIADDANDNSTTFSSNRLPSERDLTTSQIMHYSDDFCVDGNWHMLDDVSTVIQEILIVLVGSLATV
jgi:hypothetical protein